MKSIFSTIFLFVLPCFLVNNTALLTFSHAFEICLVETMSVFNFGIKFSKQSHNEMTEKKCFETRPLPWCNLNNNVNYLVNVC